MAGSWGQDRSRKRGKQPQVIDDEAWTKVETLELERSRWIHHVRDIE